VWPFSLVAVICLCELARSRPRCSIPTLRQPLEELPIPHPESAGPVHYAPEKSDPSIAVAGYVLTIVCFPRKEWNHAMGRSYRKKAGLRTEYVVLPILILPSLARPALFGKRRYPVALSARRKKSFLPRER
jgi:hypothetical protein